MIAKIIRITSHTLLTAGLMTIGQAPAAELTSEDAIAVARSVIKADRHATVTQTLQLTEAEAEEFWPLYHQYRAEMDQVGDGIVELLREYSASYPNVPEDLAGKMLKKLTRLEKKRVATRSTYLKEFGEVLPASKNLRFAQMENRLDLALLLELAARVPLVPIEGKMTTDTTGAATQSFPVRVDVDVSKRKVGEQVVLKVAEMIAVRVSKN